MVNVGTMFFVYVCTTPKGPITAPRPRASIKGDSYILLHTYKEDASEKMLFDLHFWIGAESSQDEYGTCCQALLEHPLLALSRGRELSHASRYVYAGVAAYKSVQLDDLLAGRPVQHRQTMGHETELFLSYFPDGAPPLPAPPGHVLGLVLPLQCHV